MKTTARMIALLLVGLLALSGCSAVRSMLAGDAAPAAEAPGETTVAQPSTPRFKFYDSFATW